jgi:hypothetical protein
MNKIRIKIIISLTFVIILNGICLYASGWNYLMRYSGHINGKYELLMFLDKIGNKVNGRYIYIKQNKFISLIGNIVNGKISMKEYNDDLETGNFTGTFSEEYIRGIWESADNKKKFNFTLERERSVEGLKIDLNKTEMKKFVVVYDYLVYSFGEYKFAASYFEIPAIYGYGSDDIKIKEIFNAVINSYGDDYRNGIIYFENIENYDGYKYGKIKLDFSVPFSIGTRNMFHVYLYDGSVFSYGIESYSEDGAHPDFRNTYHTLDIKTGKPIDLDEIFNGDYKEILKEKISKYLVDNGFKNYETNSQGKKLIDLWVEQVDNYETTDSIILTEDSIIIGRDVQEFGYPEYNRQYIKIEIPYYDISVFIRNDGVLNKYKIFGL